MQRLEERVYDDYKKINRIVLMVNRNKYPLRGGF